MRSFFYCFVGSALLLSPFSAFALKEVDKQIILEKIEDYEICQSRDYSGDFCHEALVRWTEKHPMDNFKAGKMTRKIMNAWVAIPFFAKAFDNKKGDCKDEDVKLAVASAINLPTSSNKEVVDQAKKIGFELCYKENEASILKVAQIDSYAFTNVCKELVAKGALTGLKAKKCNVIK